MESRWKIALNVRIVRTDWKIARNTGNPISVVLLTALFEVQCITVKQNKYEQPDQIIS